MVAGKGFVHRTLTLSEIHALVDRALDDVDLDGKRVLTIIPDGTRSGPIDLFFRLFHQALSGRVAALDYLIALGTHQPMPREAIYRRLRLGPMQMANAYAGVRIFNHHWDNRDTFRQVGVIPASDIEELSRGMFSRDLVVSINKMVFEYDHINICGPVFPHEVVGFSGGNKYFFPGISGPEVVDVTHWLGALIGSGDIVGTKRTPVRAVIDRAASFIDVQKLCFSLVVRDNKLAGLYIGSPEESWSAAADLSAQLHVTYVDTPFERVLSVMPRMYDDMWTAAKGMYKVEPVVCAGGEVIVYAPHIDEISYTHGAVIEQIGYHVRDYFLENWDAFRNYPWSVLAHSTHLRGAGTYERGVEKPRIDVVLATGISRKRCELVNLGYRHPGTIVPEEWADREDEGILLVEHAGEKLYRLSDRASVID
jgi:nickel-dependent lactate racemase